MRRKQLSDAPASPGCDTPKRENGAVPCKTPYPTLVAVVEHGGQTALALRALLERAGRGRAALLTPLPHHDLGHRLRELARQGHSHALLHYLPDAPLPPEEDLPRFQAVLLVDAPKEETALPLLRRCEVAVVDRDDRASLPYRRCAPCPLFTYSERHAEADLTAENTQFEDRSLRFEAVMPGQIRRVFLPQNGSLDLYHALAALSGAVQLGLSLAESADALSLPRFSSSQTDISVV